MKNIIRVFFTLFLAVSFLKAEPMKENLSIDGYSIELTSKRDLSAGSNEFFAKITKDGKEVNDAKLKAKFFMPEMPGMPYMEHEGEAKFENGVYRFTINFCMDGTWQYNIKFKTADDKVHSVKSSVSF
ncbi:putative copper resistance protein [Aliarcobacter cibarius]|uniref:Putative copper resistance protein n=1 Tax=Aliarcobacter cibarius TaxID=255507 RepID=A0A7L5JSF4_9BACT|nr:FixH family protein [Aliarcobacter cibarius]QKJ28142.1 putative copper resistance protein [Aliarcobacter cibarius]